MLSAKVLKTISFFFFFKLEICLLLSTRAEVEMLLPVCCIIDNISQMFCPAMISVFRNHDAG